MKNGLTYTFKAKDMDTRVAAAAALSEEGVNFKTDERKIVVSAKELTDGAIARLRAIQGVRGPKSVFG